MDDETKLKRTAKISILLFILFLIWVIMLKLGNIDDVVLCYKNLSSMTFKERFLYDIVPFEFTYPIRNQKLEVVLNGIIFCPLGVLLCLKDNKIRPIKHILICFGLSLSFEIIQLFTMLGGFATDDLIMNTSGYFLGLIIYLILFKNLSKKTNTIILKIFNIILICILLYASYTTIKFFPQYLDVILRKI